MWGCGRGMPSRELEASDGPIWTNAPAVDGSSSNSRREERAAHHDNRNQSVLCAAAIEGSEGQRLWPVTKGSWQFDWKRLMVLVVDPRQSANSRTPHAAPMTRRVKDTGTFGFSALEHMTQSPCFSRSVQDNPEGTGQLMDSECAICLITPCAILFQHLFCFKRTLHKQHRAALSKEG